MRWHAIGVGAYPSARCQNSPGLTIEKLAKRRSSNKSLSTVIDTSDCAATAVPGTGKSFGSRHVPVGTSAGSTHCATARIDSRSCAIVSGGNRNFSPSFRVISTEESSAAFTAYRARRIHLRRCGCLVPEQVERTQTEALETCLPGDSAATLREPGRFLKGARQHSDGPVPRPERRECGRLQ
jgi:hypothetical protein